MAQLTQVVRSAIGARSMTQADWNNLQTIHIGQFTGWDATGASDNSPVLAAAIAALRVLGGGTIQLGRGTITVNGIAGADGVLNGFLVPYSGNPNNVAPRVRIVGEGRSTVLQCGSNNMVLARYSDSHCSLENVTLFANGKAGCTGLGLMPETQNNTAETYQLYNRFDGLYFYGFTEGTILKVGKTIAGSDSGCYYNRFTNCDWYACTRGVYLPNLGALYGGLCNRNQWVNCRIGQFCNTGFQNDGGSTLTLTNVNFENISAAGPNATATALIDSIGGNNYFGCMIESSTRHIQNSGGYNTWVGGSYLDAQCLFTVPFRTVVSTGLFTLGGVSSGVVNPAAPQPFEVQTPGGANIRLVNSSADSCWVMAGGSGNVAIYDAANANAMHQWRLNGAEKMRLNAAGYLKASNSGAYSSSTASYHELDGSDNIASLIVKSTVAASQSGAGGNIISTFSNVQTGANLFRGENGGVATFLVNANGNISNTNNVYGAISDAKLKTDIVPASSQWNDIKALQLKKYRLIDDPDGPVQLGLIAQEAEQVSPGLVSETDDVEAVTVKRAEPRERPVVDADGNAVMGDDFRPVFEQYEELVEHIEYQPTGTRTKQVKYSLLYLKAIGALQEAMARIEALEKRLASSPN